jgi:hypothetical protein
VERLDELWPDLDWTERQPGLYRAEEAGSADADGLTPPAHWRYALLRDGKVASLIAVKARVATDLDEDGVAELLAQYFAAGRVQ